MSTFRTVRELARESFVLAKLPRVGRKQLRDRLRMSWPFETGKSL